MDQFDMASEHEQKATEIAQKYRKPEGPQAKTICPSCRAEATGICLDCATPAVGVCLWCGNDDLRAGERWCNADCRDDYERATGRTARV